MQDFIVGNVFRVSAEFQQTSTDTDPSGTITFKWKNPAGVETALVYGVDAAVVKDSTGKYHSDVYCPTSGYYTGNFTAGPGAGQSADEVTWHVSASLA